MINKEILRNKEIDILTKAYSLRNQINNKVKFDNKGNIKVESAKDQRLIDLRYITINCVQFLEIAFNRLDILRESKYGGLYNHLDEIESILDDVSRNINNL